MKGLNTSHLIEYLLLSILLAILFVLLMVFRYSESAILVISGVGSVAYIVWGFVHHALEGRLNKSIALEYMLIGLFVFLLLASVLSL